MGPTAHFTPALFEFLAELSMNNNREWFQANKARYERDVRNPLLDFVADFGERLKDHQPAHGCGPSGLGRVDVQDIQGRAVLEGQEPVQDQRRSPLPARGGP